MQNGEITYINGESYMFLNGGYFIYETLPEDYEKYIKKETIKEDYILYKMIYLLTGKEWKY